MRKYIILIAAGLVASSMVSLAQDPVRAGFAGAGSASTLSSGAYSIFGNPAALPFAVESLDAAASFSLLPSGDSFKNTITAGVSYNFGKFAVSAAYSGGKYPTIASSSEGGGKAGTFTPSETILGGSLAFALGSKAAFGVNFRYSGSALASNSSVTLLEGDAVILYHSNPLSISAGIYNLGPGVKSISGTQFSFTSAGIGGDYRLDLGESALDILGDFNYYFSGNISAAVAAAFSLKDNYYARAGFCYGSRKEDFSASPVPTHFALGLGAKLFKMLRVDLAATVNPATGLGLNVGVGVVL